MCPQPTQTTQSSGAQTDDDKPSEVEREPRPSPGLWSDRLGRWAVRSLQILLVLALFAVLAFALVQVSVVALPLSLALIVACAAAPAIKWLRGHHFPPALAAATTVLAALLAVGGLIALVVVTVRGQWDELASAASAGYEQLKPWVLGLPEPFSEVDWDGVRDRFTEYVTSPRFGVGALAGVMTLANVLTGSVLAIVLLFFFLKGPNAPSH